MTGAGKYWVPANFIPRGTFRKYGAKVGRWAGGKSPIAPGISASMGSAIGAKAGALLARLVGTGDYTVQHNTLLYPQRMVPSFGKDAIRVRKRELIAIVDSSSGFSNLSFPIQPGLDVTFPWLSAIAKNYENYHFNGLVFQYHSTSSDSIASTSDLGLGTVALCTDYNAADQPYVNLTQALGTTFANSGKPSEDIYHAIECASTEQQQKSYYVRTGDIPAGTDIRLNDMGNFQFIVDGVASYGGMGQLWVSYDVTFFKSVQNNTLGLSLNGDHYQCPLGFTIALPLGDDSTRISLPENNLGTTIANETIRFPPTLASGFYMVFLRWQGTSNGAIAHPTLVPASCSLVASWNADSVTGLGSIETTPVITQYWRMFIVRLTGINAQLTFVGDGVFPTGGTQSGDIVITQVNGDIYGAMV